MIRFTGILAQINGRFKGIAWAIIKIVVNVKVLVHIIALPQVSHSLRLADGVVLTCHMIRNEIDNHLHACLVRTLHQSLELVHTAMYIFSKIGIDVIIIGNGVGRSSLSLHNGWMLTWDAILSVIGCSGMAYHTRVPYMRDAHVVNALEYGRSDAVHLPRPILFHRSIRHAGHVLIAE